METTPDIKEKHKVIFPTLSIKPVIHQKKDKHTKNYTKKLMMIQEGHHRPVSAFITLIK